MITRTLSCLVTAASLAALPLLANANGAEKALENCAGAFVEHLKTVHPEATYRVEKPEAVGLSSGRNAATGFVQRRQELTLTATEIRRTGRDDQLADGFCACPGVAAPVRAQHEVRR